MLLYELLKILTKWLIDVEVIRKDKNETIYKGEAHNTMLAYPYQGAINIRCYNKWRYCSDFYIRKGDKK